MANEPTGYFDEQQPRKAVLSLVIGSRNDEYMGNSRWRLETALNYVAKQVHELGRVEEVEVIVTDWGSETPLQESLDLSPAAAKIVSFIPVPPDIARQLQKDSPFPEVLTVNAAARRANGQYIGRIDQDTLVGKRFLKIFFELHESQRHLEVPLASALLFANTRMLPYRFAQRTPSFWAVERFIHWFGNRIKIEVSPRRRFYEFGVGMWLIHRNLWDESGGYDERMIYANSQEINMIIRLMKKYEMVDLGKLVDYDFYHVEHYHSLELRQSARYRKVNPSVPFWSPDRLNPNGNDWGLIRYPFKIQPFEGSVNESVFQPLLEWPRYLFIIAFVGIQMTWDRVILSYVRPFSKRWKHLAEVAWTTVRGQSVIRWPNLLLTRWKQRESRSST